MRLKKSWLVILIVVAVLALLGKITPALTESSYAKYRASTRAFDLSTVADGAYEGKAFLLPDSVKVRATVSDGRLASVELLKHFNGQGKPAEAIIGKVVEAQSLGVDVVSGATHSSLTILRAVEDALSKGAE
jgi:uncharacterized protein with FMN-binding domain